MKTTNRTAQTIKVMERTLANLKGMGIENGEAVELCERLIAKFKAQKGGKDE